ncbi:thioredoxin [Alphaproteobacteria bacterium GH1-50]|uniref:Thioredoxin n=1 Tax=Kangsaoukella pontilimi TaxID=2691042 RepID=A0A7C9NGA4_9RHOB|nr:zinc-ribbon domain-containing protein [Kangsaoukella pontilimi]MXQ09339.1 thioredoxin [Kangsaoukella pontilimi]
MRLICPNCSAQYEIDASLIPDEGRDVQCSNCGHNWFELPPAPEGLAPPPEMPLEDERHDAVADVENEPDVDADGFEDTAEEVETEPAAVAPAPEENDDSDEWDWPQTRKVSLDVPQPAAPPPPRPRRPAEVAALDILKEEAERELQRRRDEADTPPIETQPDLALAQPHDRDTPSRALRARMARLRGEEDDAPDDGPDDDAYRAPRRDLLPDIDEINSSLKPSGDGRRERSEADVASERRGFRAGFLTVVGLAVLMILAYAWAPAIAGAVPATEPALLAYVDWANGARDAIDALLGRGG